MTLRTWLVLGALTSTFAAGCSKPCDDIGASADAKRLGIVLDGGRVCKEDKSVASIDYPDAKGDSLGETYKSALEKAGYTAELVDSSKKVVYATKGGDTVFAVTAEKSKERGVPFAVVRYCTEAYCRSSLKELADAMKKY
jgi:hypothetical protein